MRNPIKAIFILYTAGAVALVCLGLTSLKVEQASRLPVNGRDARSTFIKSAPSFNGWTNQYGSFQCLETPESFQLEYHWQDYQGTNQTFQIVIPRMHREEAMEANGIDSTRRSDYFAAVVPDRIQQLFRAASEQGLPIHLPEYGALSPEERDAFFQWLEKTETEFLNSCGLERARKGRLAINYSQYVRTHMPSMKPVADGLVQVGVQEQISWAALIYRLMSMVHNMEYELPPIIENGRNIQGIWAPLDSFCRRRGDCDTKAVLFSATVNQFNDNKCAVVGIPGHAFNGMLGWHKRIPTDMVLKHRGVDLLLLDITDHSTYSAWGRIHSSDRQALREQLPEVYETW